MKIDMRKSLTGIVLLCAASVFTACNNNDAIEQYLRLNTYAHSFVAEDEAGLTVEVSSSSAWEHELGENSWLNAYAENNTLVLYADRNVDKDSREVIIKFKNKEGVTAELRINQQGTLKKARFFKLETSLNIVMSPRGNYVAYMKEVILDPIMDTWEFLVTVENLETGNITETSVGNERTSVVAISDNGIVVMETDGLDHSIYLKDGQINHIAIPAEYYGAFVQNISGDGKLMVGYLDRGGFVAVPAKWVNGSLQILERPDRTADDMPLLQIFPRGCSEDGSIIYGTIWDIPNFQSVYWTEDNKFHYVAEDLITVTAQEPWYNMFEDVYVTDYTVDGIAGGVHKSSISPNGRYMAVKYQTMNYYGYGSYGLSYHPVFYDLQGQRIIAEFPDVDGSGTTITDDGLCFYATPDTGSVQGYVYDMNTGVTKTSSEWVYDTFGIDIPTGIIYSIGKDGKSVMGIQPSGWLYLYWYVSMY